MPLDHLKYPHIYAANAAAAQRAAQLANLLGKGLPCTVTAVLIGPLVTVKFEVNSIINLPEITMPVATYQYVRPPIQVGEHGRAYPGSTTIEPIAGMNGQGRPNLLLPGNLATLQFVPVSSANWPNVQDDLNQLTLYGYKSVKIMDSTDAASTMVFTSSGITVTTGAGGFVVNGATITQVGEVVDAAGVVLGTHLHSDAGGSGDSGPPIPG